MRDRANASRALLRSQVYRGTREDGEAQPASARVAAPGARRGGAESEGSQGVARGAPSPATSLALLGLLDLLT